MVHRESLGELFVRLEVLFEGIFRGWLGEGVLPCSGSRPEIAFLGMQAVVAFFISMRFLA